MKAVAVNGSPRKHGNTGSVVEKILEGAVAAGAEGDLIQLSALKFRGCVSCFECKKLGGKHFGMCALHDDLSAVLEKALAADILIVGSPIYWGMESSLFRAFAERLWFPVHTYDADGRILTTPKKSVALVYTMNVTESAMHAHYDGVIQNSQSLMQHFFGTCDLVTVTDTLQFSDYSRYSSSMFDAAAKQKQHETVFPQELQQAFELGRSMALR